MRLRLSKPNIELQNSRFLLGIPRKKMARILKLRTPDQLYRWEKGIRYPSLDHAFLLSFTYRKPVEVLFPHLRQEVIRSVPPELLTEIRAWHGESNQRSKNKSIPRPVSGRIE